MRTQNADHALHVLDTAVKEVTGGLPRAGRALCLGGAALGALGLAGWLSDAEILTVVIIGRPVMMPNTAASLLIAGLAAADAPIGGSGRRLRTLVAYAFAFGVLALGAATIAEYAIGWNLGIDQMLVAVSDTTTYPGRPSPHTAVLLTLLGCALVIPPRWTTRVGRAAEWLTLSVALAAFASLVAHFYEATEIYELLSAQGIGISLPSAAAFLLIAVGLLLRTPGADTVRLATSRGPIGTLVRRLSLVATIAPLLLGAIAYRALVSGWVDLPLTLAALTTLSITAAVAFILTNARKLDRVYGELEASEHVRRLVDYAPVAIAMLDAQMRYVAVSARWRTDFDLVGTELHGRSHYEIFPDSLERWQAIHRRCLAGAVERGDDELFVRADGSHQWLRWEMQPWHTASGRVGGIIIFTEDITTRRKSELALRAGERRLRLALDASAAGLWAWDVRTNQVVWDDRSHALYGFVPDAPRAIDDWVARLHEDDRAHVLARLNDVRQTLGDDEWNMEFRVVHPDGTIVWIQELGRAERDADGQVTRLTGINLDISARKRAEEALHESRDQQHESAETTRLLLEAAAQGIVSVDGNGIIVTANAAVETMFGFAAGELIGQSIDRLLPQSLRDRHARHRAEYWAAPRPRPMGFGMELSGQRKDGSTLPVEVSLSHVVTSIGGRAIAFVTDITERVRDAAALRESEQRLRLALDAAAAGTWVWNVASNLVIADERTCARLGVAPNEPFPFERFLAQLHQADRARVAANIDAVRDTSGADGWDMEYRVIRQDGYVTWIQSVGRAERDPAGRAVRVSGISLDVTARKESDEEVERSHAALQDRAAELEQRTVQLSQLASDLTLAEQHAREQLAKTLHDHLQQLLFSATLKLDRLAKRGPGPAFDETGLLARARGDIDEAIAAARSLSVELFPPVLYDGGLAAALAWLAERMQEKYGLTIELSVDPDANPDRKDVRTLLFESVRELLFNVVKHAKVDRAAVDLLLNDNLICITVADRGAGFDPEVAFSRLNAHRIGLGLFSIRERVALLGGRLDVDSAPGRGTRFTLVAPRQSSDPQRSASAHARSKSVEPSGPAAEVSTRAIRILIADDHAVVRKGLRELLADHPELQVVGEASDGVEAIAQAHALQPDVIVMDVSMPHVNGVEATRRIRAELPCVQIFGLSTEVKGSRLQPIEEAGAVAYLTKGDDVQLLIDRLLAVHAMGTDSARG